MAILHCLTPTQALICRNCSSSSKKLKQVSTCVRHDIICFLYHLGICNEVRTFEDIHVSIPFWSINHVRNLHTYVKNCPSIKMIQDGINPYNNLDKLKVCHLEITHQISTFNQYYNFDTLGLVTMLIIYTHAFMYIPIQHR